jgi:hypothetical protein
MPTNVYSMLTGPGFADAYEEGIKLSDLQRKSALEKQQVSDDQAIRASFRNNIVAGPDGTPTLNNKAVMSDLMRIDPIKGLSYQKQLTEQDQAALAARQKKRSDQIDLIARAAGSAKDQASYEQALAFLHQNEVDVSGLPKQYDKNLVDGYGRFAMNYQQQQDQFFKQKESERGDKKLLIDQQRLGIERENLRAKREEASGTTAGRKKLDTEYAKDFNDFTGGGAAKARDAIKKLKDYAAEIEGDNGWIQAGGGTIAGSFSDAFRTEKSVARRDNIVTVANAGLKAAFGGQLSDGERKAAANEFYNDKLSNSENIKTIRRKIGELENGLAAQQRKAEYFGQRGTLTGLEFEPPKTVRMRDPKGNIRDVPESSVDAAKRAGGKVL